MICERRRNDRVSYLASDGFISIVGVGQFFVSYQQIEGYNLFRVFDRLSE